MNRTLLERVRCLLSNAGLSKEFWGEAVMTAAYLVNRCPSSTISFKTPLEKWTDKPPNLENLRVFGCVAYAHSREGKLDKRAKKCMFLGYPQGIIGYRLWYLEKGEEKCLISRDVVFDELNMTFKNTPKADTKFERKISEVELDFSQKTVASSRVQTENSPEMSPQQIIEPTETEQETIQENLQDYRLVRDRIRRQVKLPARYASANLVYYALVSEVELEGDEPLTYEEAMNSKDREK